MEKSKITDQKLIDLINSENYELAVILCNNENYKLTEIARLIYWEMGDVPIKLGNWYFDFYNITDESGMAIYYQDSCVESTLMFIINRFLKGVKDDF